MPQIYTAVLKEISGWCVGWIEELPGVNCQEATREELLDTLRITLREALELYRGDNSIAPTQPPLDVLAEELILELSTVGLSLSDSRP